MTNKDFIKLLLISVGCDKKYEIDSHRTDDGSIYYCVTGEEYDENQSICFDGFSMYDLILSFLNNIIFQQFFLIKIDFSVIIIID